jgi:hypothetical protein
MNQIVLFEFIGEITGRTQREVDEFLRKIPPQSDANAEPKL